MTILAPFGRLATAMVTPFKQDLSIDWDGVSTLATHLLATGHDAIVVNGTTGEAPTTSDDEKDQIIRVVLEAVGTKAKVIAGAGNNETTHSVEQALRAEKAGAHALLVVTPYYNKPPQAGIEAHFRAIADSTDLPIMLYDIPGRTGMAIEPDTIVRLAEHPKIVALKDAKGDVASTSWVIKRSGIPVYSGDDILNLPLLSVGAVGFVSVCGHTVGTQLREMLDAWFAGNSARALEIHQQILPVFTGTFRTQGAILTKAALTLMGLPGGHTRLPLVDATPAQISQLREDLLAGGVTLTK
ncbi:MAG: 4-hydroxy-tetrahydrodipicolinate synthase [Candidatus Nanopelagicaceae bacterium]